MASLSDQLDTFDEISKSEGELIESVKRIQGDVLQSLRNELSQQQSDALKSMRGDMESALTQFESEVRARYKRARNVCLKSLVLPWAVIAAVAFLSSLFFGWRATVNLSAYRAAKAQSEQLVTVVVKDKTGREWVPVDMSFYERTTGLLIASGKYPGNKYVLAQKVGSGRHYVPLGR